MFFKRVRKRIFGLRFCFLQPKGSESPSETPFGERSGDFGVPRAPSEIGEWPPWAPWVSPRDPSRLPLSGPVRKQMGPSQHRKSEFHFSSTRGAHALDRIGACCCKFCKLRIASRCTLRINIFKTFLLFLSTKFIER